MVMVRVSLAVIALCYVAFGCSQERPEPLATPQADDQELADIVAADQADREAAINETDWASVNERDASRRARVRELIEAGRVRTGKDFDRASLVFQHGSTPTDILFAHVLAMTALAEGHPDSRRMAALTLDRYLTRIGQPQVFGTNFSTSDVNQPSGWTLEPYDETLVPDSLRAVNCVASRDSTRQLLARLQMGDMSEPEPVCGKASDDLPSH
jgi:hypothetical protein